MIKQIIAARVAQCKPTSRCNYFRHCEYCARIRQARFADKAQQLFEKQKSINLLRVTPEISSAAEIERVKDAVKRQIMGTPSLWTVEQGEVSGLLHINILTTQDNFKQIKRANQHFEPKIIDIRAAAAYILKKSQYPDSEIYRGRTYGTFGRIIEICLNSKKTPEITAAAADLVIKNSPQINTIYLERQLEIEAQKEMTGDYKTNALKHLPHLRAYIAANKRR